MKLSSFFGMKLTPADRQLIAQLAERMERTESDAVRLIVRQRAAELGLTPTRPKADSPAAHAAG